jgi:hypothetical protein
VSRAIEQQHGRPWSYDRARRSPALVLGRKAALGGANLAAIMLGEAAAAADRGWGRLERKNFE